MGRVTQRRKVHKYVLDGSPGALEFPVRHREDVLAVEEPLEIRLGRNGRAPRKRERRHHLAELDPVRRYHHHTVRGGKAPRRQGMGPTTPEACWNPSAITVV